MILCIDTAIEKCAIALCWEDQCIDFTTNSNAYRASEILHLLIQELLQKNKIKLSDLQAIAVNGGPGSYTGLRIGATTAKGLCYALNIPLIHIDGLQLLTQGILNENPNQLYAPMIDARRMEVFTAVYNASLEVVIEPHPEILTESYLAKYKDQSILIFGNGAEKAATLLVGDHLTFDSNYQSSPTHFKHLVWKKWLSQAFENKFTYTPNYLKKFFSTQKPQ